jgi:glycosyltransferase involved in cell wall biosynthesis
MKILQVMAGAEHGGAETAFVDMCIALHEAGETLEVVTRMNDTRVPQLKKAGLHVHMVPMGGRLDIFSRWRIAKIIKNFQPHIVQTWMSRAAAHTPRWDVSMQVPPYFVVSRLGGYYKLKYFKSADYFITITPAIRNYLIEQGVPEEKAQHINNFAETEVASQPVDRAEFETPKDAPLLLALGRLHTSKAFDTLIKAVSELPGCHLWIAGEGPERENLKRLIHTLGVGHRVKLLGWREDRAALLQACDICVFPSRYEPFGTVFVQAWAQHKPVVASDADGPRQFIRNGDDGLLFPIDDIESLKNALKRLIENDILGKRLADHGHQRYLAEFTREKAVAAYLALYHDIRARAGLTA